jgi:hypothetical protein
MAAKLLPFVRSMRPWESRRPGPAPARIPTIRMDQTEKQSSGHELGFG